MRFAASVRWRVSLLACFLFRYSPWLAAQFFSGIPLKRFGKNHGCRFHLEIWGLRFLLALSQNRPPFPAHSYLCSWIPQTAMPYRSFHLGLSFLNFARGTEKCAPSLCHWGFESKEFRRQLGTRCITVSAEETLHDNSRGARQRLSELLEITPLMNLQPQSLEPQRRTVRNSLAVCVSRNSSTTSK